MSISIDQVNPAALKDMHVALAGMISQYRQLSAVGLKHELDLSQYFFGTIIWNKSLGKPLGVKPSDGFIVRLHTKDTYRTGDAMGGPAHLQDVYGEYFPSKWDDSDADHYLVHFLHRIPDALHYDLHATIADGVTWVDEANHPVLEGHFMSPSVRLYGADSSGKSIPMPSWIEPFYVVGSNYLTLTQPAG